MGKLRVGIFPFLMPLCALGSMDQCISGDCIVLGRRGGGLMGVHSLFLVLKLGIESHPLVPVPVGCFIHQ